MGFAKTSSLQDGRPDGVDACQYTPYYASLHQRPAVDATGLFIQCSALFLVYSCVAVLREGRSFLRVTCRVRCPRGTPPCSTIMGSPDARQIDGLGGADALTSKVGIVRQGTLPGVDLEFLFAQVSVKEARVDTTPNCGNMLAAVVPFALETGLVLARGETTTLRVLTRNTGTLSDIEVLTPGKQIQYAGSARSTACRDFRTDQYQLSRHCGIGVRLAAADRASRRPLR